MKFQKISSFNLHFSLFISAFFIFQIFPFYPLYFHISALSSHSIARYLLLYLLAYVIFKTWKSQDILQNSMTNIAIAIFVVTQSLSAITAMNWVSFIELANRFMFGIIIYVVGCYFLKSKKAIWIMLLSLFASIVIITIYQFIIFFYPSQFNRYLLPILYEPYLEVIDNYYALNKLFVDIFNPAFGALILFLFYFYRNFVKRIGLIVLFGSLIFFSIVSNFRTHALMLITSVIFELFILFRGRGKIPVVMVLAGIALISIVTFNLISQTTIDRLFLPTISDYATLSSRTEMWALSTEMGLSSPLFGVGIGNFYDNFPNKKIFKNSLIDWKNAEERVVIIDPHNIFFSTFAQTGFLGLFALIFMLFTFIKNDIQFFKENDLMLTTISICFWSLFLYSLLNPAISLQYLTLYWVLRSSLNSYKGALLKK